MTFLKTLVRTAALGVCVVAFAGSAAAGNGSGKEKGGKGGDDRASYEQQADQAQAASSESQSQEKKGGGQERAGRQHEPSPAPSPAGKPDDQAVVAPQVRASARAHVKVDASGKADKADKAAASDEAEKTDEAEQPEQEVAAVHAVTVKKHLAPRPATPVKAAKPAHEDEAAKPREEKPAKAQGESAGRSAEAQQHVIVCHRTGSAKNPYVVINIPLTAWNEAHSPTTGSHPALDGRSDILLKNPASRPGSKDGFTKSACATAAAPPITPVTPTPPPVQHPESCPATLTTTERVLVGVWHATGAIRNGQPKLVYITPSLTSAHYDSAKHPDDVPVYETKTVSATAGGTCAPAAPPAQNVTPPSIPSAQQPQPIAPAASVQAQAPVTPAAVPVSNPAPTAEVLGAVSPSAPAPKQAGRQERPASGVLGVVSNAPQAIAETGTSGTLPFTGLPLWIAVLLGGGLLAGGIALRRASQH